MLCDVFFIYVQGQHKVSYYYNQLQGVHLRS